MPAPRYPPKVGPTAEGLPHPGPAFCERIPLHRVRSPEGIAELARQHLAERLAVPPETVEVVSVEEEMWDEPPACPLAPPGQAPDRAYPGPIAGYRIVLEVSGVQYEVHSAGAWLVFYG